MSAELAISIGAKIGATVRPRPAERVHGGSINECYRWGTDGGPIFVKLAPAGNIEMFTAEAAGLEELRRAKAVRVPRVLGVGIAGGTGTGVSVDTSARQHGVSSESSERRCWLALEWIQSGPSSRSTDAILGEQLAQQHRSTHAEFGWTRDNTIGSTPQPNHQHADWVTFFRERRLRYQLDLAARNGIGGGRLQERGAALLDCLAGFFRGYRPSPALLHGDLWGGNRLADEHGQPVIFDPAVYYGDRETDLAMTRLFGGYGREFYSAYEAAWAPDPGASARTDLYNLYHVLNHLNLFGTGYLGEATAMLDRLLAAVRR